MQQADLSAAGLSYLRRLQQQNAQEEVGFRCLCCRDSGIVPGDVIQRWHNALLSNGSRMTLVEPDEAFADYESTSNPGKARGAEAILCLRPKCRASEQEIMVEGKPRTVPRFADYAVRRAIPAHVCEWLHDREREYLQKLEGERQQPIPRAAANPSRDRGEGFSGIGEILNPFDEVAD